MKGQGSRVKRKYDLKDLNIVGLNVFETSRLELEPFKSSTIEFMSTLGSVDFVPSESGNKTRTSCKNDQLNAIQSL